MNPATVVTVAALAGAVGIWRLTRDSTPDRDRPAEPDTRKHAEASGLIAAPTGDHQP